MISDAIAQVCSSVASLFPAPLSFVSDLLSSVCGQIETLLRGFGL